MVQPSNRINDWSLVTSRLLFGGAAIIASTVLFRLTGTVDDQGEERRCIYEITTETDRLDSDINVKQAQIFEAAILRPGTPGDGATPELEQLGRELQVLIIDRAAAYKERDKATEGCQ